MDKNRRWNILLLQQNTITSSMQNWNYVKENSIQSEMCPKWEHPESNWSVTSLNRLRNCQDIALMIKRLRQNPLTQRWSESALKMNSSIIMVLKLHVVHFILDHH